MEDRIMRELELLQKYYPEVVFQPQGLWFHIPSYTLPEGWSKDTTDIAFQIKKTYPGAPPYAFYIPSGLMYNDKSPNNYVANAQNQPPFAGKWGCVSWSCSPDWKPKADLLTGSNLLNWVNSFRDRFSEGA